MYIKYITLQILVQKFFDSSFCKVSYCSLENFQTKQQMQNFWQQNISILNLIISIFFSKI